MSLCPAVWQVQFLPLADKVVVMADGVISAVGTFAVSLPHPLAYSGSLSLTHSLCLAHAHTLSHTHTLSFSIPLSL